MTSNFFLFLFSFIIPLILTYYLVPLNIIFAKKISLVAIPNQRSIHKESIPVAGGLSMALPIILGLIILVLTNANPLINQFGLPLIFGSVLITLLGLWDDKKSIIARYKLVTQIIVASYMYWGGYKITILTNPFGGEIYLDYLAYPLTVFWYLIVMNAINFIDGIDGLAAGIILIVSTVMAFMGFTSNNQLVLLSALMLMGSCLAFLRYNFYPAKIFMGDTGSLFLGFMIASINIVGTTQYKGIAAITLLIPIISLIIPILDIVLTILRRLKNKKNIFEADKEHLHHKMLALGFSQKTICLLGYFITFLFGMIAFGFSFADKNVYILALVFLVILMSIIFYFFYKKEFFK